MDISVITPFHNIDPDIFEACFQSMINQTIGIDNIEWIIVLHNCDQKYIDAVREKVSIYETIKTPILNDENNTPSSPRNHGLSIASGKYIGFLDGDDSYINTCLETALLKIQASDSDILCFRREYEMENTNQLPISEGMLLDMTKEELVINKYTWEAKKTFVSVWGMVTSKIYSREFINANDLRFDLEIPFGEDAAFNLKAYSLAKNICYLPKYVGYHYFINSASIVQSSEKDAKTLISYARGFAKVFNIGMKRGIFMNNMIGGLLFHTARFLETSNADIETRRKIRDILLPYLRIVKPFDICEIYTEDDVKLRFDYPKRIIPNIGDVDIWERTDKEDYPLTTSQRYQKSVMEAGGAGIEAIEMDRYYELDADIDEEKLKEVVYDSLCAHDIYRARINESVMRISDDYPVVALYYFTEELFKEYRSQSYKRKLDCRNEAPFRVDIICCVESFNDYDKDAANELTGKKYLHIKACHFAYDQVSIYNLFREITARYTGDLNEIPKEEYTIFDVSVNESKLRNSSEYEEAGLFFDKQYNGRGSGRIFEKKDERTFLIRPVLAFIDANKLDEKVRENGLTTGVFLIGMFEKTIADFSGNNDFSYMVMSDGRETEEEICTHGTMAKAVYITSSISNIKNGIIDISKEEVREEFFEKIRGKIKESVSNNILDFEELINKYERINSLMTVNYVGKDKYKHKMFGKELEHRFSAEHISEMKPFSALNFSVEKVGQTFNLVAMSDSFTKEELETFVSKFEDNIRRMFL